MNEEIEFETLKTVLIISYANRIKNLQTTIFSDLQHNTIRQKLSSYREKTIKADQCLETFLKGVLKEKVEF